MASPEHMNHAKNFLRKAQEYLAAAEDSLAAGRHTPAAGDAIHAGISAKDAIVTALTGATSKGKNHAAAAGELKQALGKRPDTAAAERALRELTSAKSDVECGIALVTAAKAEPLVCRARTLVDLAVQIVRLGR
jgi:HEPN domain-containing protein